MDLDVDADLAACVHARESPIRALWLRNAGDEPLSAVIRVTFLGLTSRPWVSPAVRLPAGTEVDVLATAPPPRLDATALAPVSPPAEATIEVRAEAQPGGGAPVTVTTLVVARAVRVHGPRSWPIAHRGAVSAFVRPSSPVIVQQLVPALVRRLGGAPRALLTAAGPERAARLLAAVLEALSEALADLGVLADREPFSGEQAVQSVRLAEDVVAEGRGTCVDLAALAAGVLVEVLGHGPHRPWVLLAPTSVPKILHALVGVWLSPPATTTVSDARDAARRGQLLLLDPTRAVSGSPSGGASLITGAPGPVWGLDVERTHVDLPMPSPTTGPTLGALGLRARAEAIRAARGARQLTSAHLLHGLLVVGALTRRLLERLEVPGLLARLEELVAASRAVACEEEPRVTAGFSGAIGGALVLPSFASPDDEEARLLLGIVEGARGRPSSLGDVGLDRVALGRLRALVYDDLGLTVPPVEDSAGLSLS
jgi:hypothetical protein